jgi:Fur family ferric uptake transcriptional regulator
VASIEASDGQRAYELLAGHGRHAHLVCRRCGAVTGAEIGLFDDLAAALRTRYGFAMDTDSLSFAGLCPACAASQ